MTYIRDGYEQVSGYIPRAGVLTFEKTLTGFCLMQAKKLRLDPGDKSLDRLVTLLNAEDPSALRAAVAMAAVSPAGHAIACGARILGLAAKLLGAPAHQLVVSGPNVFINIPGEPKRLYTWHAEAHWYPKRRNFVNVWFPIVRPKVPHNGTMIAATGSHRQRWDFSEYQHGDHLLQYEVPPRAIERFSVMDFTAGLTDAVVFQPGLVHSSTPNNSALPSYAATLRIFDYSHDLTVSADWAERPYREGAGGGRAGIDVT